MTDRILSILLFVAILGINGPLWAAGPGDSCNSELTKSTDSSLVEQLLNKAENLASTQPAEVTRAKQEVLELIIELNNSGRLREVLRLAFLEANRRKLLPIHSDSDEKVTVLADQFYAMVDGALIALGLTPESLGHRQESWQDLHEDFVRRLNNTVTEIPPFVDTHEFREMFARLTHSKVREGNASKALIDGPAAFRARRSLIREAEKEITLVTWAIYDDDTGREALRLLKGKADQGVKVRVIVDAQTAHRPGYNQVVSAMEASSIEVIRYREQEVLKKYLGQHRKILIADRGEAMILGGMNPGNVYSHVGGDSFWRDTDVWLKGPSVRDTYNKMVTLWNGQLEVQGLGLAKMSYTRVRPEDVVDVEPVAYVDQNPSNSEPDNVYLAYLAAIRGARHTVKIENAYFILTPPLRQELLAALGRGVRVQILSNSDLSVDEPIVSRPIMASLKEMGEAGAEIYLRTGSTLHSKFMLVDDHLLLLGSYNLHPRGLRLEGESLVAVWSGMAVSELVLQFDRDISLGQALPVSNPNEMELPPKFFFGIAETLFFDQL